MDDYAADAGSDWAGNKRNCSQSPSDSLAARIIMKKYKQAKASEGEDGVDLISNLPDHLLRLILSRLQGTEEAIRTSILSTRWRYLWTSVPSIDLDYTRGLDPVKGLDSNGFKYFVYRVLLNKSLDLDSFRLCCSDYYHMSTISQWIHAAIMRKVKLLDLMFCTWKESDIIELPERLVTCGSLKELRLCLMGCPLSLPKVTGFPALRVLELNEVNLFNDKLVEYFLENCPLLEDLSLIDCRAFELVISSPKLKNLRIETRQFVSDEADDDDDVVDLSMCSMLKVSCPKLVFLKLKGFVALGFLFEDLYSLKKAVIHPKKLYELDVRPSDLFARISHVEVLSISLYCIGACFDPRLDAPISLPNLKTLELRVDGMNMDALIPFLKCLLDLESLHLIIPKDIYRVDKWNLEDATMSILTRHLKKVEFLGFNEENLKLVVARALLEHGNELEEMVLSWDNVAKFHERSMETMEEVSKFHKASSTVKLRGVIKPSQANS